MDVPQGHQNCQKPRSGDIKFEAALHQFRCCLSLPAVSLKFKFRRCSSKLFSSPTLVDFALTLLILGLLVVLALSPSRPLPTFSLVFPSQSLFTLPWLSVTSWYVKFRYIPRIPIERLSTSFVDSSGCFRKYPWKSYSTTIPLLMPVVAATFAVLLDLLIDGARCHATLFSKSRKK